MDRCMKKCHKSSPLMDGVKCEDEKPINKITDETENR